MRVKFLIYLMTFFTSIPFANAQVVIGSDKSAVEGALLQLKENEGTNENATKGLGLPRVQISSLTDLNLGAVALDKDEHVGLTIYLPVEVESFPDNICPGIYVWSGMEWVGLIAPTATPQTPTRITDRQGNEYTYNSFGNAGLWMTQDLRITVTPCGTPLTHSRAVNVARKQYVFPNNNPSIASHFGKLYNWAAATNGKGGATGHDFTTNEANLATEPKIQGICPNGWYLPTDKDWNELEKEISENPSLYSSETVATTWQTGWNTGTGWRGGSHGRNMLSSIPAEAGNFTGGKSKTDGTGFHAKTVGSIKNGGIAYFGLDAYWWCSSWSSAGEAWRRGLNNQPANPAVVRATEDRATMYSVRCKKK